MGAARRDGAAGRGTRGRRLSGSGKASLVKRSFALAGHRTSVALEPEFWDALAALAARDGNSLAALVARIDAQRTQDDAPGRPLASALRVHALLTR